MAVRVGIIGFSGHSFLKTNSIPAHTSKNRQHKLSATRNKPGIDLGLNNRIYTPAEKLAS